ncbi:hypothetical protein HDU93_007963 [Gonapodya sp. JEL0774]|nr:hypothetical protein HDU93_007963 [Gonapodya sp. JEL0774]
MPRPGTVPTNVHRQLSTVDAFAPASQSSPPPDQPDEVPPIFRHFNTSLNKCDCVVARVRVYAGDVVKELTLRFPDSEFLLVQDVHRAVADKEGLSESSRKLFALWMVGSQVGKLSCCLGPSEDGGAKKSGSSCPTITEKCEDRESVEPNARSYDAHGSNMSVRVFKEAELFFSLLTHAFALSTRPLLIPTLTELRLNAELQLRPPIDIFEMLSLWPRWVEKYTHHPDASTASSPFSPANRFHLAFRRECLIPKARERKVAEEAAVRLLFGEARRNVLSGRYSCGVEDAGVLAGVQMQLRHGDFDPRKHGEGFLADQLPEFIPRGLLDRLKPLDWEHRIFDNHRKYKGRSPIICRMLYLQFVRQWPFYGSAFFPCCRTVPPGGYFEYRKENWLCGVNAEGISVVDVGKNAYLVNNVGSRAVDEVVEREGDLERVRQQQAQAVGQQSPGTLQVPGMGLGLAAGHPNQSRASRSRAATLGTAAAKELVKGANGGEGAAVPSPIPSVYLLRRSVSSSAPHWSSRTKSLTTDSPSVRQPELLSKRAWDAVHEKYKQMWGEEVPPPISPAPAASTIYPHSRNRADAQLQPISTRSPPPLSSPSPTRPASTSRGLATLAGSSTTEHEIVPADLLSQKAWAAFAEMYNQKWGEVEKGKVATQGKTVREQPGRQTALGKTPKNRPSPLFSTTVTTAPLHARGLATTRGPVISTTPSASKDLKTSSDPAHLSHQAWAAFTIRYRQLFGDESVPSTTIRSSRTETPLKFTNHQVPTRPIASPATRTTAFTSPAQSRSLHARPDSSSYSTLTAPSSQPTPRTPSISATPTLAPTTLHGFSIPNTPPTAATLAAAQAGERRWEDWREDGFDETAPQGQSQAEAYEAQPPELLPPHLRQHGTIVLGGKYDVGYLTFATPRGNPKLLVPLPSTRPTTTAIPLHPSLALSFLCRVIRDEDPRATGIRVWDAVGDEHGRFLRPGNVWAGDATVGDVVKEALSGASKGFFVAFDEGDVPTYVRIPTFEEHVAPLRKQIEDISARLTQQDSLKQECDKAADLLSRRVGWLGFSGFAAYWGTAVYLVYGPSDWDMMEPITYFVGTGFGLVAYLWYMITRSEYSYTSLTATAADSRRAFMYRSKGFDQSEYEGLKDRMRRLREEIESIREDYA